MDREEREAQLERERRRRARIRRERLRRERIRRVRIQRIKVGLCAVALLFLLIFGIKSCRNNDSDVNSGVNNDVTSQNGGTENELSSDTTPTPSTPVFVTAEPVGELKNPVLICIDAGHGFADPGCVSDNLENGTEADITLKVANNLKDILEAAGAEVVLTHDGVTYPSAQEIKDYATQYGVSYNAYNIRDNDIFSAYERAVYCQALGEEREIDFFISLHINAADNTDASRYDVYYSEENPFADKLAIFCSGLQANADNKLLIHETTRSKSMYVTKYSKFPSVLLEMGYATNLHDAANLNSDTWRRDFAKMVADQIIEFLTEE